MPYSEKEKERKKEFSQQWRLTIKGRAHNLYFDAMRRARVKGIEIDLDKEWLIKKLTKGKCQITGAEFDLKPLKGKHFNPFAPSIDRVNPKKGYTKRNCKVVLWGVNNAKAQMSMKEYKAFTKLVWEGINND